MTNQDFLAVWLMFSYLMGLHVYLHHRDAGIRIEAITIGKTGDSK